MKDSEWEQFLRRRLSEVPVPPADIPAIRERVLEGGGPAGAHRLARRLPGWLRPLRSYPGLAAAAAAAAILASASAVALLHSAGVSTRRTEAAPTEARHATHLSQARERAQEIEALDGRGELDLEHARTLMRSLNFHLKLAAQSGAEPGSLQALSDKIFDRVAPILEQGGFLEEDPEFPVPVVFVPDRGLCPAEVETVTAEEESSLPPMVVTQGGLFVQVEGQIFHIDPNSMKVK